MMLAWAAHWGWLIGNGPFSSLFLESAQTSSFLYFITGVAIVEIALDKLPKMGSRLTIWPLVARIVLGGCSAALLAEVGGLSAFLGAVLGVTVAVASAYAGNRIRTRSVKALNVPDFVVGFAEDAVAIGLGFFVISRFA